MSNVYVQRNLMESERYFPARGLHPQSTQGASAVTDTSPPLTLRRTEKRNEGKKVRFRRRNLLFRNLIYFTRAASMKR